MKEERRKIKKIKVVFAKRKNKKTLVNSQPNSLWDYNKNNVNKINNKNNINVNKIIRATIIIMSII